MARCKVTVLKRGLNTELVEQYAGGPVDRCPFFQEGQEFICSLFEKPQNFCDWAWNDINKVVAALGRGGNFNTEVFHNWMKDDKTMVVCCTDGMRPVSFKVERLEE